jgi:hypothetical protein
MIAVIGNIYSDEILFRPASIRKTRPDLLTTEANMCLLSCIKEVLQTVIDARAGAEMLVDRLPETFLIPHRNKGVRCQTALERQDLRVVTLAVCASFNSGTRPLIGDRTTSVFAWAGSLIT